MLTRLVCLSVLLSLTQGAGMLYPRETEFRQIQEMNGFWDFRADMSLTRDAGFEERWFERRLSKSGSVMKMPVPSSYNDITTDKKLRDFVGWVWYDREFFPSGDWQSKRVVLRFDSSHYNTIVWINGQQVMEHAGGHLPFQAVVNDYVEFGKRNYITVAVNNTLSPTTLPPGTLQYKTDGDKRLILPILPAAPSIYPPNYVVQNVPFDFFNYAGIHRSVRLYVTPKLHVDDINITTSVQGTIGVVNYEISTGGGQPAVTVVEIHDADDQVVDTRHSLQGTFLLHGAKLWWPYTMSKEAGYQYTMQITIQTSNGDIDIYRQTFGIRTVAVTKRQILINGQPFYCHGVNKHEDADIRGKGLDHAIIARDFHMMKWLGANCLRTSHYPYAEEFMDEADRQGFVVIDECPGVGITSATNMGPVSLAHHLKVMTELITRDKNRPAVIMWSIANEPASDLKEAESYFRTVIDFTRQVDPTGRPITFVSNKDFENDRVAQFVDVLCINRYYAWYSDMGHLEVIPYQLKYDLERWYETIERPLIISEYGADTVPGLNSMPSQMFTEDYQLEFNQAYHEVFDQFRSQYLVGELVWNFADFMTTQSLFRPVGNRKGILTRQREPKQSAWQLRSRYNTIINETRFQQFFNSQPSNQYQEEEPEKVLPHRRRSWQAPQGQDSQQSRVESQYQNSVPDQVAPQDLNSQQEQQAPQNLNLAQDQQGQAETQNLNIQQILGEMQDLKSQQTLGDTIAYSAGSEQLPNAMEANAQYSEEEHVIYSKPTQVQEGGFEQLFSDGEGHGYMDNSP